jgi:hypothetical protein
MANDNDLEVVIPDVSELPTVEEGQQDPTDWKAKAQELQGQLKESRGIARRFQTKLKKSGEPAAPAAQPGQPASQPEKKGFDYAEKAYLKSSGIESTDFEYLFNAMKETGKDLDTLLESKFVQAELKERKDLRMSEAATPSGSKRAGNTTRDQVDYWLAKGELPPTDQPKLRREVVNARIKAESEKTHFTDQPVGNIQRK